MHQQLQPTQVPQLQREPPQQQLKIATYTCDIVLLGLQGTGKTFLVKQLQSYLKGEDITKNHFDLIPSFGVNLDDLHLTSPSSESTSGNTKNAPPNASAKKIYTVRVREVGGGLLLGWNRHINDCKMIVYVVDMSNRLQLAASCIEMLNLISALQGESKPFLVLLNKMDAPCCIPVRDFERMSRWNDLLHYSSSGISNEKLRIHLTLDYLGVSSFTGQGFEELVNYLSLYFREPT